MKILFVNDDFAPESVGGAGKVVLDLSLGLKNLGHEVTVFTTTQKVNSEERFVYADIPVIRPYFNYKSKFLRSYLAVFNPFLVRKLLACIREERPDVVHFHNVHSFISFAAIKAVKRYGVKKVFLTAHDVISFSYTRLYHFIDPEDLSCRNDYNYRVPFKRLISDAGKAYNPFRNIIIRHYLSYCDKIFAVSGALKKALNQNGISNVDVVYNGININEFVARNDEILNMRIKLGLKDEKIIFFGGRGMSGKGADVLLNALGLTVKKNPKTVLVIASEHNSYENYLKGIISRLGIEKNVIFPGLFSGRELASIFSMANLIVVPSTYFDPAPLMVMQAMTAGKPVIGTCFGGTPEVVEDGVTGFIVNPYNIALMSDKITQILNDNNLEKQMGARGLERIKERFNLDRQIKDTLEYYLK